MLQGVFAPVFVEGDATDLPVTGEIPEALNGTFYRNGANPQFAPRGRHHWFGGDGMVHAFTLENGRASYRNRWVRTPRFEQERKAGEALFGLFGDPTTSDPSVIGKDTGVANTHIIYHAGKLLALEESHLPFEMTRSLNFVGYYTFGGLLPTTVEGRFTAHPKIDPVNGELVGFSYSGTDIFGTRMSLIIIGSNGELVRQDFFEAPYCSLVHDFLVTRDHVVFPILPLAGDMARAKRGGSIWAWDPSKPAMLGVVGRRAPISSLTWHRISPCYVFHAFNAWEDGGSIHCDVIKYGRAPLFPDVEGNPTPPGSAIGMPVRWSIDLTGRTGEVKETQLTDVTGEFPRLDERRTGVNYSRAFYNTHGPEPILAASAVQCCRATGPRVRPDDPFRRARWRFAWRTRVCAALGRVGGRRRLSAHRAVHPRREPERSADPRRLGFGERPCRPRSSQPPRARRLSWQLGPCF